ncbi:MAG: AraC family transcriptional regulator, partial [Flavobacterium nitrogenifigens]|uniref:helix-turn-helix domain-containing protein n=1 Tax=Flavobacterium nitrogenifigens TaxID=1617283 RepID=UPI002808CC1A
KNYLTNNLYGPFPSLIFLAGMAGMSASKYKSLFKKRFNNTPKNLFIEEKIKLAQKLLKSGEYSTLSEVMYELNYTKLSYFSSKYFELLKRKPTDDFLKKNTNSI